MATAVNPDTPALQVRHVSKTFGGVRALRDVSLTIRQGEIHGLLGENGSGKSTLIKILAGYHAPDHGAEMVVSGTTVKLPLEPGRFRELGLSFVHQDLGLIPSLSVLENLIIGKLTSARGQPYISWRRERAHAREILARFDLGHINPRSLVEELTPLDRALVAIVRAFEELRTYLREASGSRGLLVLDEPTVFLPRTGTTQLFDLLRRITSEGASVLFVSHDLDEVREITDCVTVLRDGAVHGTVVTGQTSEGQMIEMIIGRQLDVAYSARRDDVPTDVGPAILVGGVSGRLVQDLSLEIRKGEVLGVTGLAGCGLEELPYLLVGAARASSGRLEIAGRVLDLEQITPDRAMKAGIVLVPADRQGDGAYMTLPVIDNALGPRLDEYSRHLLLRRGRMAKDTEELMRTFDVRPADPRKIYALLSGGNQQKALLAKWLQFTPTMLVLHEPTQGVDVGARGQIFRMLRSAAASGVSVLCASSDYEQLSIICDRVLVLSRGRVVDELVDADVEKHRIAERSYNTFPR